MTAGFCWGHASVTSKFNRLATFKPQDRTMRNQMNARNILTKGRALGHYRRIIDRVINNEVVDIPGFASLREFASHPDIQSIIKDRIADAWSSNAMSTQGLSTLFSVSPMSQRQSEALITQVKSKTIFNQQPQLLFTTKGDRQSGHVVLVSEVKRVNGRHRICIRDNNYPPSTNHGCRNYMEMQDDGSMSYTTYRGTVKELGKVQLAHNDHLDAVAQYRNLRRHCLQERDCR
jgi:hypothetical protein